jgi:hypothetical protein
VNVLVHGPLFTNVVDLVRKGDRTPQLGRGG